MDIDVRDNADELERILKKHLMDSRTMRINFCDATQEDRINFGIWVDRLYKELGGDRVKMVRDPSNSNAYILRPEDDPINNYPDRPDPS